jgi:RimJ/RimL family protein N-acetyltransferase
LHDNRRVEEWPGNVLIVDELTLRPWQASDAPALLAACQDPDIARWAGMPQPFREADAAAFIEESLAMWLDGSGASFAIVDSASGALLGAISRYGPEGHQATFGCWVTPAARGRGIATRALRSMGDWTFATTSVLRLHVFIMVGNEVSERMVLRAGYQREGLLRAWDVLDDGTPVDCVVYSRLRGDA